MTHTKETPNPGNIGSKLIELAMQDQNMRINREIAYSPELDIKNSKELETIIAKINWPSISKVGKIASWAAWLIAQHSDYNPEFQKKCLSLLNQAYKNQDIHPLNHAYLTDRVMVNTGMKQLYGTQWKSLEEHHPIKDYNNLDRRRALVGLVPFEYSLRIRTGTLSWEELYQSGILVFEEKIGPFYVSRM